MALFDAIADAFHRPSTALYRWVNAVVWSLIVLSIGLFVLELVIGHDHGASHLVAWIDQVVLWLFVAELTLRVATFRPPAVDFYERSFWGRIRAHLSGRLLYLMQPLNLVDLITVLALVPALRGLRALRLLRLLRSSWIFRENNLLGGIFRAFEDNALLFGLAFSQVGVSVVLGGVSIWLVERTNNSDLAQLGDGIWWALVTLTTVGYGDVTPVSALGRVIAGALMIAGMFTLALFAGVVGHTLLNTVLTIREEQYRVIARMNHVVICGYDEGAHLLLTAIDAELSAESSEVVIFAAGERPHDIPPRFGWISGNPTKEAELDKVRLTHAAAVIVVGPRNVPPQQADAQTILTVFTIRAYMSANAARVSRQRPLYVIAEILDHENVRHAYTAGVDEVIETTRLGFSLVAHAVSMPGTAAIVSEVAAFGKTSLYVGRLPEDLSLPVKFFELARQLKASHDIMVIGVRERGTGEDAINPSDDFEVTGDHLVIYLASEPTLPRVRMAVTA